VGRSDSLELQLNIPSRTGSMVHAFGSASLAGGTFNLLASEVAGPGGVATFSLPGTNAQFFYTAVGVNTNTP